MKQKANKPVQQRKRNKVFLLITVLFLITVLSGCGKESQSQTRALAASVPKATEVVMVKTPSPTTKPTNTSKPKNTPTTKPTHRPTDSPVNTPTSTPIFATKTTEKSQYPFYGYISVDEIIIRNEPTFSSDSVATLWNGADITVLNIAAGTKGTKQSWYEISFEKNKKTLKGYVPITSVSPLVSMQVYNASISLNDLLENKKALPTGSSSSVPKEGKAVVVFQDYGIYSGNFKASQRSGQGSFIWQNQDRYDGEWEKDQISGKGTLTWADGTIYKGTFSKGKLTNGSITLFLKDKRKIVYTVSNNDIQQKCSLIWPDGTTLEGKYKNSAFVGEVTILYANGDKYIGELKNGLKSGKGTYTWKNGASYNGEWATDQMNGNGSYYFSSNKKSNYLQGKFKNNQPYGTITYTATNGLKYDTMWSNGTCTSITVKK